MSFNWRDEEVTSISISADLCAHIYSFIEETLIIHESVIIHGIGTQNTSFLVAMIYIMQKFKWTLKKSFEYLLMKWPVLTLNPHIAMLLQGLENHLTQIFGELSDDWDNLSMNATQEEVLAHNTHTNVIAIMHQLPETSQ